MIHKENKQDWGKRESTVRMERLKLIMPGLEHETEVIAYRNEFLHHGESMDGTAGLEKADSYQDWMQAVHGNRSEETVQPGLVPASTYLALRAEDNHLVGMIDIRHRLNEYLLQFGGHIGYSVRRSERRNGYATEMLKLALNLCQERGMTKVLVTCDKANVASARTILRNGGMLENELPEGEDITQRYWVML